MSQLTHRDCAREVLDAVPPVVWFIRRNMRGHRGGLSLPQFRALVRVDLQPTANLSAIAEHLGSSLPTVSRIVAGLVDKGLVARAGSRHDRRQMVLSISRRGRAVLEQARRQTQRNMEAELRGLSLVDCATVMASMLLLKQIFAPLSPSLRTASLKPVGRRSNTLRARRVRTHSNGRALASST